MITNKKSLPAEAQEKATKKGVLAELNDEAIQTLIGFFDVLILMDQALEMRKERSDAYDKNISNNSTSNS